MEIRIADTQDYPGIAGLIMDANQSPRTQCIHSGTAETVESLVEEITKYSRDGELVYVVALEGESPVGCFGCEFERTGYRGWLRGPIAINMDGAIFESMFTLLRQNLPENVCQLDSFLNEKNVKGQAFYENMGFQLMGQWHVYLARRSGKVEYLDPDPGFSCERLGPESRGKFSQLHDRIFPDTSYNGQAIINLMDDDHQVWVAVQAQDVLGYVYATIEPWADEGYIEYVAVREDSRRRGIAAHLLSSALQWIFDEREMPQTSLTVSDRNVNARNLYERVGFELMYSGVNHQLLW